MSILIRTPKPDDHRKYILNMLHCEEDDNGKLVEKEYIPTDVTWIYGSTEEARQNHINDLIEDVIRNSSDETIRDKTTHVDKITKAGNIKGEFAEDETTILIIHNLKRANISEQEICRLIDGGCFNLGRFDWNNVYIFPKRVYISSDKTPEQIYARDQFKDRVIRRVTRVIKID